MSWNQKERERVRLLSNEELFEAVKLHDSDDSFELIKALEAIEELESRLRLSGFFDMPLEFYLGELGDTFSVACHEDGIQCYSERMNRIFIGKTALEAAKAAYKWKTQ